MEFMTPEERFTKIENLLKSLTENQVQMQADIQKHNDAIRDLIVVNRSMVDSQQELTNSVGQLAGHVDQITMRVDQLAIQVGGIDERIDRLTTRIESLHDTQRTTEEKLHVLIETVDRIIRNREN